MRGLLEDLEDDVLFAKTKANDDGRRISAAVLDAELAGEHPVRAWRNNLRMTQDAHGAEAGISKLYLNVPARCLYPPTLGRTAD